MKTRQADKNRYTAYQGISFSETSTETEIKKVLPNRINVCEKSTRLSGDPSCEPSSNHAVPLVAVCCDGVTWCVRWDDAIVALQLQSAYAIFFIICIKVTAKLVEICGDMSCQDVVHDVGNT